ncbi:MAG: CusA/CzcA family heavy metal efflux RND transporter [Bacteroidia bacterium]|nr:CusA/CzcA family heavy metal efflux RND transporter [Bacteroidia bacterium]MCO5254365.1 CusA/CzcA family heavy metal efflux RND transporter [Bacteroidota bacterium]
MLHKIIEFSIKNKLIIGLLTAALVLFGVYETTRLPIDAVPDITNNQVQIITSAPSLGATEIERLVTFPIELENSNIKGIEEIRSFSRFGLSVVTIVFADNIDIYWARQQIAERLQLIQKDIPAEIGSPELGPITTGLGEIYQYVVRAKKGYEDRYDITQLRTIQDWIVRRQLLGVSGVAEVSSFGGKLKQYEIAVDAHKLQSFGLSLTDLFEALKKNNQNTGGAYIEKGPTVLYIRSEGLIQSISDIEKIAVKSTSEGIPVFVKDIATVKIGFATRYGALTYNDEGEAAGAIVMMLKDENSSEVVKNVKKRIESIKNTLPEGVTIEPFLDRTKMVNNAIHTISKNLSEGALIVVFVLVLFLGNFRAGFLVASVIPLSMLFAIIMMNIFGVSGNLMSLGALDFGLIVDGAVIIVEAVMHQLHSGKKFAAFNKITQKEMDAEVSSSATKMVNSAVFGQIIILIVYLPIFSLQGIEGKMFKPMAQTVTFALLGAFILSLTYIPMMSALVISKQKIHAENWSDKLMARFGNWHTKYLKKILQYPKLVIGTVVSLFIVAIIVFARMGGEFIPTLEEGDFAIELRVLTGSNLNTTVENAQKVAHILKKEFPEVITAVTKIGSGEVPTDPMPIEAGDMIVLLKNKKEWTSAKTFPELAEKMSKALEAIPGVSIGVMYPVQMRFNELMTGAKQDVVCKIFGENLDSLAVYAQQMGEIIKTVEGAEALYIEPITGLPQILIQYDRAQIAQYGLDIFDVNNVVNTAFAGQSAGYVYEGEKRFHLVLRLDEKQRTHLEDIQNLLVSTPQGTQIPLSQLAKVSIENGPAQIQREDAKRRVVVGFNIHGRDVQSIVEELQSKVGKQLRFAPGYYTTYGGAFENLQKAKDRLMIAVPVALILIFILLFFAFNSLKESLLIYTAIPLSTIGGVFLLALRGMPFSISAGVGFIALFGVAVLNGIVLIAEYNRLKKAGESDLVQIVLQGTHTRLRPVLMTALVASLGFLPMALSHGSGAEVQRPLATVVIGGLLFATFLTLFVLPTLFIIIEKIKLPKMKIGKKLLTICVLLLIQLPVFAQRISYQDAISLAEQNNLTVQNSKLMSEYYAKRKAGYFNVSHTNISGEFGQINSNVSDNKLGVSQVFDFPTVYSGQKKIMQQEWQQSLFIQNLSKAEIRKELSLVFYQILVLKEQETKLLQLDSQYALYVQKAKLRFDKGANNILELSSAEIEKENISNKLKSIHNDIELAQIHMQLLLNSDIRYEPESSDIFFDISGLVKDSTPDSHPIILAAQQEINIAQTRMGVENSKLLPNFSLGYYNQSFHDIGNNRYGSYAVSVGIPIFFGYQKSNIRSQKKMISLAENQLAIKKQQWIAEYKSALQQYQTRLQIVQNYIDKQLPKADLILQTARQQYDKGEINYLEMVLINNQALQIQLNYYEAMMQLNQTAIQLQYLTTK